jgi:mRNA-degrading endonuclease RelE of RelBE toxin-antitoxin system
MALRVQVSAEAAKRLKRAPQDVRTRLLMKIQEIAANPLLKGSEALVGSEGLRRARVGGWRIVYSWTNDVLQIEAIGRRGQIYKDLMR